MVEAAPRPVALTRAASRLAMLRQSARTIMLPMVMRPRTQVAHVRRQGDPRLRMPLLEQRLHTAQRPTRRQRMAVGNPMAEALRTAAARHTAASTSSRSLPNPAAQAIQSGGAKMAPPLCAFAKSRVSEDLNFFALRTNIAHPSHKNKDVAKA
jgi:hypothetical protein